MDIGEPRLLSRSCKRKGFTVSDVAAIDAMTPEALDEQVSMDEKNRRAPLEQIREVKLRRGVLNGRLSLVLNDGTRIKLLWLKADPAHDILSELFQDRV